MRKYLLAAVAVAAIASPAAARDGAGYVGIEGGILSPRDNSFDADVNYTTTQTPSSPLAPAGPADTTFNNAFNIDYKRGLDLDLIGGYDFGMFRLEGELGYKRASIDEFEMDSGDLAALNAALNRPSAPPDPAAPGFPALVADDFGFDGRATVISGMVNALLDLELGGFGVYAGGGFGRARVQIIDDSDAAWAHQLIAGVRGAVTDRFDLGLKYRYFRTGRIDLEDEAVTLAGNRNRFVVGTTNVDQLTSAVVGGDMDGRFQSHSLLLSLIYNFAPPPPPPPPPAPPPPPPEPAVATQTCPDGSVILATDMCPPPPPPPPPPPSGGERG